MIPPPTHFCTVAKTPAPDNRAFQGVISPKRRLNLLQSRPKMTLFEICNPYQEPRKSSLYPFRDKFLGPFTS